MSKKWVKVSSENLCPGTLVKHIQETLVVKGVVGGRGEHNGENFIYIGGVKFPTGRGNWFVRNSKKFDGSPIKDGKFKGHGAEHWHKRFLTQMAHTDSVQLANANRRNKLDRVKADLKQAKQDTEHWSAKCLELERVLLNPVLFPQAQTSNFVFEPRLDGKFSCAKGERTECSSCTEKT